MFAFVLKSDGFFELYFYGLCCICSEQQRLNIEIPVDLHS
jgi:hypothetical protein